MSCEIVVRENERGLWQIHGRGRWLSKYSASSVLGAARTERRLTVLPFTLVKPSGERIEMIKTWGGFMERSEYERGQALRPDLPEVGASLPAAER